MSASGERWQVRTMRPIAYEVIRAPHLFAPDNTLLLEFGRRAGARRLVVLDEEVARYHGESIRTWFDRHGVAVRIVTVAAGEEQKSLDTYQRIVRELDSFPIHRRDDPIIAIGGGVVTDIVAFVAASYRRGVPHIKIPTTLMGYIDAALGIKAGINFNGYKNRLGSFEPPLAVLLDPGFLSTLTRRQVHNGLCEIIKLAVIADATLFGLLEADGAASVDAHFANPAGSAILERAINGMLKELAPNLFEDELARKVDFGHTFSCGLEMLHVQRLLHGEAVLLDILVSVHIAEQRGLIAAAEAQRVFALVQDLEIAIDAGLLDAPVMWQSLLDRIEHRNGLQRVPIPAGIGNCVFVNDITRSELDAAATALYPRMSASHEPALEH